MGECLPAPPPRVTQIAAPWLQRRGAWPALWEQRGCDPCVSLLKSLINHPAMLIKWSWTTKQRPEHANLIGKSRDFRRGGQYLPFLSQSNSRAWLRKTPEQQLGT